MTVTVQSALSAVQAAAGRLHEAVQELLLIAVEDGPRGIEVHLATIMHDAALDLAAEAEQATGALGQNGPAEGTRRAAAAQRVARYQARINMLGSVLVRELVSPERITELSALGATRGREAGAWAEEIVRCIETCQHLLWTDVQPALLAYWEEIIEMDRDACSESGHSMARRSKAQWPSLRFRSCCTRTRTSGKDFHNTAGTGRLESKSVSRRRSRLHLPLRQVPVAWRP
jgi:hypothetical protein